MSCKLNKARGHAAKNILHRAAPTLLICCQGSQLEHMPQVMTLPKEVAEAVLGTALQPLLQQRMAGRNQAGKSQVSKPQIEYQDLEMHRVVGTGQFGMVRVVRHIPTNQAYALKVITDFCM